MLNVLNNMLNPVKWLSLQSSLMYNPLPGEELDVPVPTLCHQVTLPCKRCEAALCLTSGRGEKEVKTYSIRYDDQLLSANCLAPVYLSLPPPRSASARPC